MAAIIISVGDELVSGLTVNTNATWLSQQLAQRGIRTAEHLTVGDALPAIIATIRSAMQRCNMLIISGGLGPTEDDLTRGALAAALDEPLVEDAAALAAIEAFFRRINRPMSPSNALQARRPASARCLANDCGTAPGMALQRHKTDIFALPGVPREMKAMFTQSVLPAIQTDEAELVARSIELHTTGLGESLLGERIGDLMKRAGRPRVGTAVHDGIVSIRVYADGPPAEVEAMLAKTSAELHRRLGALIFGQADTTLEQAVGEALKAAGQTAATAESCTGGMVAGRLTNIPGSSAWFTQGWITYSNESKAVQLRVPRELIAAHGAVSHQVALAMAQQARTHAAADWAISVTGIAGPDGGTADKPIGLVFIGVAGPNIEVAYRYLFPGGRADVRLRATVTALNLLRLHVLKADIKTILS